MTESIVKILLSNGKEFEKTVQEELRNNGNLEPDAEIKAESIKQALKIRNFDYIKDDTGEIYSISGSDPRFKRAAEWINGESFFARALFAPPKLKNKDLENAAMNAENLQNETLYLNIYDTEDDDIKPYDYGESLVMLAPTGVFEGTGMDGCGVEENITDEAISEVIRNYDGGELLLDVDHKSMDARGDTSAAGWIYGLQQVKGLFGKYNGLYGRIKWTSYGKDLVQSRQYRFISPVFKINEDGTPYELINAGLTNTPALETILPILNSKNQKKDNVVMIKDEKNEPQDIDETSACGNECPAESDVTGSDEAAENSGQGDAEPETKPEIEKKENGQGDAEQGDAEPDVKEDTEAKEDTDVIKLEVLNKCPSEAPDNSDKLKYAMTLKGQKFFDYLRANPEIKNMY